MPSCALDGPYDQPGGYEVGTPRYEFPFEQNGDMESFVITRSYKQTPRAWIADRLSADYKPGVAKDSVFPDAYLLSSSVPTETRTGLFAFTRTFARIPKQQIVPSSMFITKPALSSFASYTGPLSDQTGSGLSGDCYLYGETLLAGGLSFLVNSGVSLAQNNGGIYSSVQPTGGTFTLTFGANTTGALAYNASDSAITTAINGLASVIAAGLTFSAQNGLHAGALVGTSAGPAVILTVTAGSTSSRVTMNAASLTPSTCGSSYTLLANGSTQWCLVMWRATITAHGFDADENLIMHHGGDGERWQLMPPDQWEVVDANTVAFYSSNSLSAWDMFGQEGGSFTYKEGTVLSRIKRVTDFYLPGVSDGIETFDDIPLPLYQGSPGALVGAILAGSTEINYEVGELTQWGGGPILARTITKLNAATL